MEDIKKLLELLENNKEKKKLPNTKLTFEGTKNYILYLEQMRHRLSAEYVVGKYGVMGDDDVLLEKQDAPHGLSAIIWDEDIEEKIEEIEFQDGDFKLSDFITKSILLGEVTWKTPEMWCAETYIDNSTWEGDWTGPYFLWNRELCLWEIRNIYLKGDDNTEVMTEPLGILFVPEKISGQFTKSCAK